MTLFFLEAETLESKQFHAFLERESPACEVVLASDAAQAAILALNGRSRQRVLVVQGGLADGRADELVRRLCAQPNAPECVAYVDRRPCRENLAERPDDLESRLRDSLGDGWLLVRFLEPGR